MGTDLTRYMQHYGEERQSVVCKTTVYRSVERVCAFSRDIGFIGRVVGASGIGKTTAARAIRSADWKRTLLVEVQEGKGNGKALWRAISEEMGIAWDIRDYFDSTAFIAARLSGSLVIIDEAQRANANGLETLRYLWDQGDKRPRNERIAMVLMGNEAWFNDRGHRKAAEFAKNPALVSRIGVSEIIDSVNPDDVRLVCEAHEITAPDLVAYVQSLPLGDGWMRTLEKLIVCARALRDRDEASLYTLDHLKRAASAVSLKAKERTHA